MDKVISLQITVVSSVNPACLLQQHSTAIVIDVLRATSNIITAFMHGCLSIIPVETIAEAIALQTDNDLLGGERGCLKINDFDLGNSCSEYQTPQIKAKRIVLTTTNGTRVIRQSSQARHLLVAAFLNARACAAIALQLEQEICILCAGTKGQFSLEDGLCAGMLVDELLQQSELKLELDDMGLSLHASYLQLKDQIEPTLLECTNGKKLSQLGYSEDIAYCSQLNITDIVPVLIHGALYSNVLKPPVLHTLI